MKPLNCLFLVCLQLLMSASIVSANAPANDNFSNAIALESGTGVSSTGNNINATIEADETLPDSYLEASVWFKWTANKSEQVQIDAFGSDFFLIFAVWSGTSLSNLDFIAEGLTYGAPGDFPDEGRAFIEAVSGETYYISVYSYESTQGNINLNISESTPSSIGGTVLLPDGTSPAEGINAQAYILISEGETERWEWASETVTDANGGYHLQELSPGTYRVGFFDYIEFSLLDTYYSNATDLESATDILVGRSESVSNIDATLDAPATISGSVTKSDGITPTIDTYVSAYSWNSETATWEEKGGANAINGNYVIRGLRAGTYRIRFDDSDRSSYAREFYDDTYSIETATDITLASAENRTNINASLSAPNSSISGVVTASDLTTPLAGVDVTVYRWDSVGNYWANVTEWPNIRTEIDGTFTANRLAPGTYRIKFADLDDMYVDEYYGGQASIEQASDIVLGPDESITSINESLSLYSWISGEAPQTSVEVIQRSSTETKCRLSWDSQIDAGYSVKFTTDFEGWETIGGVIRGTGNTMTFEHDNSANDGKVGFYRLLTEPY